MTNQRLPGINTIVRLCSEILEFYASLTGWVLFFVDFYFQQIEVHESGIKRQTTYTDTHILGFQSLVGNKVAEAVFLVIVERLRTVQGIDNKKAATCAVVGAEEYFNKVHNSCTIALTSKLATGAKTTNEYGRETFKGFIAQIGIFEELLLVFIRYAVGQADAVVRKRESGDDGVGLALSDRKGKSCQAICAD